LFVDSSEPKTLRKNASGKKRSSQLTLIRTYAMCGVGETQKAPTSIKLVWTGIKRKVCRAYI
jgi:hypothetical protein